MSYLDYSSYYESEPSEVDMMIDEATDNIKRLIVSQAADKVNAVMKKADKLQEQLNQLNQRYTECYAENEKLQKEIDKLNERLEEKPNIQKYKIGQAVFVVTATGDSEIVCSKCDGSGYIHKVVDNIDYKAECPVCGNRSYPYNKQPIKKATYVRYCIEFKKIQKITIDNTHVSYGFGNFSMLERFVFDIDDKQAAEDYAKKLTDESKEKAEKKLKGIWD